MQEAEQEIAVEERIRDAYRKEEEEKAGNLKAEGESAKAAAIWRKNEGLKKMVLEKFITRSPVDQFQIRGQFWNPWEKIFDWYFMIRTRMVAIWHKNERLKKMVLEEP